MRITTLFFAAISIMLIQVDAYAEVQIVEELSSKLAAKDAVGFIALLPSRITNISKPNTAEAADLALRTAVAMNNHSDQGYISKNVYSIGAEPIYKEILLALIVRGAPCNKADVNNKTTMEYIKESRDDIFVPAIQSFIQHKQQYGKDKRLEVARHFLDAVAARNADVAFALIGEEAKKDISMQDLSTGFRRMLPEGLQGPVQCLAVIKYKNINNVAACFHKNAYSPGVFSVFIPVGVEAGQIKVFTGRN